MSSIGRITVSAAIALTVGSAANAAPSQMLSFSNAAAEVGAATRLLSAYGVVTSTFRTVAHNKAVGGVPNSYHLLDRAIDIVRRPGITHVQLDAALRRAGYRLVESLDEHDHSHFAFAALDGAESKTLQTPAPQSPPSPPPKPLPRVAADEHGTLAIDLEAQSGSSGAGAAKPQ